MKFKNLFKIHSQKSIKTLNNDKVYSFSLIHKPTNTLIHPSFDLYPTREIAEWSAINYFNWFLQQQYKQDEVIIGIHDSIPQIIDSDNVRQTL